MATLDAKVRRYVRKGYIVQSQTDTSAQLVKPKKFSFLWAFAWFMCFGGGLLVYLLYYWAKRDHTVYLSTVTSDVKRRGNSRWWSLAVVMLLGLVLLCLLVAML
jgi:hypothetical protein